MSSVQGAVADDLVRLAEREPGIDESTEAALALALAREIDDPGNSATSKSMCARALADVMAGLREMAPDAGEGGKVEELARRAART